MTEPEAVEWVDRKLSEMMEEFGDSVSGVSRAWRGNVLMFRFSVSAFARFEGTLTVTDEHLDLNLPFPLLARSREGAAKTEINRWLDQNLPK
jgi:hypothetical protein